MGKKTKTDTKAIAKTVKNYTDLFPAKVVKGVKDEIAKRREAQSTQYADSYANVLTGLGLAPDKSSFGVFRRRGDLNKEQLDSLYEQDAIAARVVDRVVDDATRESFFLTGTDETFDFASVQSELEDLHAVNALGEGWKWARLYGGAIVIMVVNDNKRMEEPLDLKAATKLSSLQVVESPFVMPQHFNPGLGARAFRNPEHYNILLPFGADNTRRVHRSRVIRFDGLIVPPTRMIEANGWGPSVVDRIYTELEQLGQVLGYARNIMHEISLTVFKLNGLRDMLCGSDEDQQNARKILETLRFAIDNLHSLALDKEDDYAEVTRSVQGLEKLIMQFVDALVRGTDMPRTILLGEQPGGINANADSEIRAWYDFVASQQKLILTPALNRLLEVIFAIRGNKDSRLVPEEWVINYRPLTQPTREQNAETMLKVAQASEILILNGIVSPEEIRAQMISMGLIEELEAPEERASET